MFGVQAGGQGLPPANGLLLSDQWPTFAQIYDKWVANIPKRVGFSFSPSLAATFNLTGFNGSDFGSGPRSPEESPEGATEGNTGPTAGAAVTGIVARCRHQLYSVGLVSSRSELPLSLMM